MSGAGKKGNVFVVVYATHTETVSAPLVTNTSRVFLENGPRRKNVQSFPNVWHILLYVLSLSLPLFLSLPVTLIIDDQTPGRTCLSLHCAKLTGHMEVSGEERTWRQRCLSEIETLLPVNVLFLHHSSVQDSIYVLGKGHTSSTLSVSRPDITVLSVRRFPNVAFHFWNSSNVRLTDDSSFSSFSRGRPSRIFPFSTLLCLGHNTVCLHCCAVLSFSKWGHLFFGDVPLVEFKYLVFTLMPGASCRRRLRSLLLYLCYVFRVLINSLVCWFWVSLTFSSSWKPTSWCGYKVWAFGELSAVYEEVLSQVLQLIPFFFTFYFSIFSLFFSLCFFHFFFFLCFFLFSFFLPSSLPPFVSSSSSHFSATRVLSFSFFLSF